MRVFAAATLVASFVFFALPNDASAQALGVGVYGDSEVEEFGVGANFVFHTGGVVNNSRAGIDLKYWIVDGGTYMTGNIDGQYLWFKGPTALSYGLLGLNVSVLDPDFGGSVTDLGINLGAGAEFTVARGVALYGEAKFLLSLGDIDSRFIGGAGVRFYFGGGGGGNLNLSDM